MTAPGSKESTVDRLGLTCAELAFLLSFAEGTQQERAWARLRLRPEDHTDAVTRAGLSSLVLRGLVGGTGGEITLSKSVGAVLRGLSEPSLWVAISAITAEAVEVAHLYVNRSGTFLLSPRPYGCFDVQGVRRDAAPSEIIGSVARRFVTERRPAMVTCHVEPAAGEGSVAIMVDTAGAASVAVGQTSTPSPTLDDALRSFGYAVAATSPTMTGAVA